MRKNKAKKKKETSPYTSSGVNVKYVWQITAEIKSHKIENPPLIYFQPSMRQYVQKEREFFNEHLGTHTEVRDVYKEAELFTLK